MDYNAISIFGEPFSGKSTLLRGIENFYFGEYLRRNIDYFSEEIRNKVTKGVNLDSRLFREVIQEIEFEARLVIFDGAPRTLEQYGIMSERFNFIGGIEIVTPTNIWKQRVLNLGGDRTDRDYENLKLRRNAYLNDVKSMKKVIHPWVEISNGGSIEEGRTKLSEEIDKFKASL